MNVVAHEHDDLLFLSPDLVHDVQSSRCVHSVFVTAGDAGNGTDYRLGREAGVRAAYARMAGVANVWSTRDAAGNPLAAGRSWTFTTAGPRACPCSLWDAGATPAKAATGDGTALELGMRFQSETAGRVTGIRFYKGAGNTGTHVGHLWTSDGSLLATAIFANESATGWQTVNFDTPDAIAANTTYVASYFAPAGHFALDRPYFTNPHDSAPLHALANGTGGGNGVYYASAAGSRRGATGRATTGSMWFRRIAPARRATR